MLQDPTKVKVLLEESNGVYRATAMDEVGVLTTTCHASIRAVKAQILKKLVDVLDGDDFVIEWVDLY